MPGFAVFSESKEDFPRFAVKMNGLLIEFFRLRGCARGRVATFFRRCSQEFLPSPLPIPENCPRRTRRRLVKQGEKPWKNPGVSGSGNVVNPGWPGVTANGNNPNRNERDHSPHWSKVPRSPPGPDTLSILGKLEWDTTETSASAYTCTQA